MRFFKDAELRRGEVYIASTGAHIPLDAANIKSIARQFLLFFIIQFVFFVRLVTGNRVRYTIGFVPEVPKPWYKVWNVTRWLGIAYSDNYPACDVLFYFEDRTHVDVDEDLLNSNKAVLNGHCTDISKSKVEQTFEQVFGYGLAVDPKTDAGPIVMKSQDNAAHDGQIIQGPVAAPLPGKSYQRFVENCYDGEHAEDIRVPIVGGEIPLVYIKRRPIAIRFANDNTECIMVETVEALSPSEVDQLIAFSQAIGLDFGGLDVLRDRETGKIYVVDVNKTDMGPPIPLKTIDKVRALTRLGRAFVTMLNEKAA
jgi:hypothetical protein